ncbi:hypothetical protein [Sphingomonas arantia]
MTALATLAVWVPALCLAVSLLLASVTGCAANEAGTVVCMRAGIDIAVPISMLGIMGWAMLPMIPFMAGSVLFWVGYVLIVVGRWGFSRLRRG